MVISSILIFLLIIILILIICNIIVNSIQLQPYKYGGGQLKIRGGTGSDNEEQRSGSNIFNFHMGNYSSNDNKVLFKDDSDLSDLSESDDNYGISDISDDNRGNSDISDDNRGNSDEDRGSSSSSNNLKFRNQYSESKSQQLSSLLADDKIKAKKLNELTEEFDTGLKNLKKIKQKNLNDIKEYIDNWAPQNN